MSKISRTEALNRIAGQAVPDHLDLWDGIRAGIEVQGRSKIGKSRGRRLVMVSTVAVVLALIAGATYTLWNPATPVNAEAVLDQAQASASSPLAAVHSYHLVMSRQVPAKQNALISTEIWFGGSDKQRSFEQIKDSGGVILSTSEIVFNGTEAWIATIGQGRPQVLHTVGTIWNEPAEDPSRQNSLTDVLTKYAGSKGCTIARLEGDGSAAGQAAYVISVTPKPGACKDNPGMAAKPTTRDNAGDSSNSKIPESKDRVPASGGQRAPDSQLGQMLIWIDKSSFLPLKTEVRDASGNLLDQQEVTSIEYNLAIPDSIFAYTPPPGARVVNFSGGTGADVKALCADPTNNACPYPKKP